MICTEQIINKPPLVIRRRVKWGECDPACVVYTMTFSEYVISAAELFYSSVIGTTPQVAKDKFDFATPTRALTFDFRSSLRPDDEFDMTVMVGDIRSRTYVLNIAAHTPVGKEVFFADLTPICVARGEQHAIEIPAPFRSVLEKYQANCLATLNRT